MRKIVSIVAVAFLAMPLIGCQVRQTKEAEAPEVEVKGGQLPEYDVDTADVDVGTKPMDVEVPDVDVSTETRTVQVPDIDVKPPSENRREEAQEGEDPNR